MYNPKENINDLEELLRDKSLRVIGVVGDKNQGKSGLLYNIIDIAKRKSPDTPIVGFKLSIQVEGVLMISSLIELSKIKNSLIILDEWADLVDMSNRKDAKAFEAILRTIYHPYHNNTVILCGLARNFNGKISGELEAIIFKQTTLIDIIQRSTLDHILKGFHDERKVIKNEYMLIMPKDTALIYHPGKTKNWHCVEVPYLKDYDVKLNNPDIFVWKSDTESKQHSKLESLLQGIKQP